MIKVKIYNSNKLHIYSSACAFISVYYVGKTTIKIKSKGEHIHCAFVSSIAAICALITEPSLGKKSVFLF